MACKQYALSRSKTFACHVCKVEFSANLQGPNRKFCNDCYSVWLKARMRASQAVFRAIKKGKLPAPSTKQCMDCSNQAQYYDHRSYAYGLDLDVVPVCRACNFRRGPATATGAP